MFWIKKAKKLYFTMPNLFFVVNHLIWLYDSKMSLLYSLPCLINEMV